VKTHLVISFRFGRHGCGSSVCGCFVKDAAGWAFDGMDTIACGRSRDFSSVTKRGRREEPKRSGVVRGVRLSGDNGWRLRRRVRLGQTCGGGSPRDAAHRSPFLAHSFLLSLPYMTHLEGYPWSNSLLITSSGPRCRPKRKQKRSQSRATRRKT